MGHKITTTKVGPPPPPNAIEAFVAVVVKVLGEHPKGKH
jgi:hypothetical protein